MSRTLSRKLHVRSAPDCNGDYNGVRVSFNLIEDAAGDRHWPSFRGPEAAGSADGQKLP
jgi:hypothetical protein